MSNAPFTLPIDRNGKSVPKFLDAFELVRWDETSEPKYYGYVHPDGSHVITCLSLVAEDSTSHITFFHSSTVALATSWADRATLTYVEYDAIY
jgi:hypothetical protein